MPMKVATNRIPNIYELFYDKNGDLLKSPDTIRFKAQDNYANLLIINLEDGIEDDSLVLINFTPKNAVINYTTHWFYVRPLKNVREVIIEGENTPRVFTSYVYEAPRIVLNNNAKDMAIENTMTIVKRYGFNSVGVFNNYSSLINSHPANVELYDTNGFAYILNDETVGGVLRKKGYYQVIEKTPNNYEWTIRENVMNFGLEQKQYETKKAFVERGYANVKNVPNVEGTVIEALWRDLSIIINDISDLKSFYDLELVLEETNTILGEISKINESYFVIKNNVKIDELENDLLEVSVDGLYVKHDDAKVDKITYEQDITVIREDIIELDERVDTLELNETALTGRIESLETQVDINTNDIVDLDVRVDIIEETIDGLNLLVKIDNETITRNSNQEIQVSEEVISNINSRTKNTDFVAYQQLVQDFLNGKLDKKPDGIIDLITPLNKIDARYLDIDTELFIVVLSLPAIGIPNKIYLVPKSESETQNLYDEFIYLENKWEKLGTITIDLSNFYNIQEVDALLNNKVEKVSGKGLSTNDFTNVLKDKLEGIDISQLYGGKNLASPDLSGKEYLGNGEYFIGLFKGVSVKYNVYSGFITFNGTSTDNTEINLFKSPNTLIPDIYNFSFFDYSNNQVRDIRLYDRINYITYINMIDNISKSGEILVNNSLVFWIYVGSSFTNYQFKFQIEKGIVSTPYTLPLITTPEYIRQTQTPRLIYSNSGTSSGTDITFSYVDNTMKVGDYYFVEYNLNYDNGIVVSNKGILIADMVSSGIDLFFKGQTYNAEFHSFINIPNKELNFFGVFGSGDENNLLGIKIYKVGY